MLIRWIAVLLLLAPLAAAQTPSQPRTPLQPRVRYALRAGDVVTLDYRYTLEFNQTVTLRPDGYVDLALLGSVHAAGLTLDQLHDFVVDRAGSRLKDPELTLSLKDSSGPTSPSPVRSSIPAGSTFTKRPPRSRPFCSPAVSRGLPSSRTCTSSARSTAI